MKPFALLALFAALLDVSSASAAAPAASPLASGVIPWDRLQFTATKTGSHALVFDAPTVTLDKFHCHVSTLNPGENTGPPHRHPQEEFIIVKQGTLEANIDGKTETAATGSMIFYAESELENMRNPGSIPATYYVIQFFTAKTPKPPAR